MYSCSIWCEDVYALKQSYIERHGVINVSPPKLTRLVEKTMETGMIRKLSRRLGFMRKRVKNRKTQQLDKY